MGADIVIILIVILIFALMWRGPKTLPKIGQALGRGLKGAKAEVREIRSSMDKRGDGPPA